ncbi:efflux RND transporter permease subunit [Mucisphaera calidilacus]|uniref:Efflux pump membrane transporter BepE n=1 Tax=Mucisphaera calidilacus TaxID=2527982 RepID=A0A518BVT9_9BACT|nr:multidrug efflux RND transporter permease subunit [Mucisphaera calidilacus]QDU71089.1 Efflux pump membrane transporter BepE [Mucisphaera calidilacus]
MLTSLFVNRPILASVLSIIIVIGGFVSLAAIPITQYPDITPVQVTVSANYPGADAQTVANSVAAPLETEINGADALLYMQSRSSANGQMTLTAYFALGTDPDTAEVQVQNRVNRAMSSLPDSVTQIGVTVEKRSSSILMLIALYSPDNSFDENYISNYANVYVLDALKRVEGANQASIMGLPDQAMRIWLNPERMASLQITPSDIASAVSRQNQQFSAGTVAAEPMNAPVQLSIPVVTEGRYDEPDEFESIIVRAESDGSAVVRVGDVARAEVGLQQYLMRANFNGQPSTFVAVYQQPGSNALQVAANVRAQMEELKKAFPSGVDYRVTYDTTKVVQASIDEVVTTLIIAVILVVLVTYIFLQSVRATIIPTLAIIVSIIGTFVGMLALGFSLNLLTLFGLVLAIGIVCDDAIVVVENVERNIAERGLDAKKATILAMGEVIGPVIATTLVLIAVFLPVAFLGGTTGVLYKQFAITIAVSVSISSFVALTLTPALCGMLLKPRGTVPAIFKAFNAFIDRTTDVYGVGVRWTVKAAPVAIIVVLAMLAGIYTLFRTVPSSFVPVEDQGFFIVAVIMPDGASMDRTEASTSRAAELFLEHPAVVRASAISGYSLLDSQLKTNAGTIFVELDDFNLRKDPALSINAVFAQTIPKLKAIRDGVVIPINPPSIPGLGTQGGFEFWIQNRGNDDPIQLFTETREFINASAEEPILTRVNSTYNAFTRQLLVSVDRTQAETLGMPVDGVYDALQSLFGSVYVSQYNKYGRVWNVVLQADAEYRDNPTDIQNIFVRQRSGAMLPLSSVVSADYRAGPDLVARFNGFPAAKVTGDASPGFSSGQAINAMEELGREVLPDTFSFAWSGQAFEEKKAGSTSAIAFVFGIIMVFLILAGQYERWSLPLAIITAVPFGIFGALVAVFLRGMENDIYFQVGLVTLIGLSTKNAILIVEFAQVKHSEGLSPFDAAVEAARLRLRPILMTSLSFILGALPLVTASGAGSAARHSIGTGIIGGMISATTLALFFVPLFYYLIVSATSRGQKPPQAAPAPAAASGEQDHA